MIHLQQSGFQRLENRFDQSEEVKADKTTFKNGLTVQARQNNEFVGSTPSAPVIKSNNIFVDGTWSNRYFQYGIWHGPFKHYMKFNFNNNIFEGYGTDNVGESI